MARRVPDPTEQDILVLPEAGPPIDPSTARDVIGDALGTGASTVAIPVGRLEAAFFDLRSGLAGDVVQAFVTYGVRLVIVGELPEAALASRSFAAFVKESNRGGQPAFVQSLEALAGVEPDT